MRCWIAQFVDELPSCLVPRGIKFRFDAILIGEAFPQGVQDALVIGARDQCDEFFLARGHAHSRRKQSHGAGALPEFEFGKPR